MKIILERLVLENFKGIKNLTIDFKDKTTISGDNALGKTTVFDAYTWLLWDKDSLNRKGFGIKPYDKNGKEIHNLESSVEGNLVFGNSKFTLKKIFKEIWTKKRGSKQMEFTGHTTDYYINAVPVKKKEYNERIASVVSEDSFNLLSNPLYFNGIIDKNKRREILLSLIEDVEPGDVIKKKKALKDLDLEHYTVDELKKMAKDTSRKINKDIESIPARIDELSKTKVDKDFKVLEFRKSTIGPAIKKIDEALADVSKSSDQIKDLTEKIAQLEAEKADLLSKYNKECLDIKGYNERLARQEVKDKEDLEEAKKKLEQFKVEVEDSRKKWQEVYKESYSGDYVCPTCHQDLLPEQVERVLADFNLGKSNRLREIEERVSLLKIKYKESEEYIKAFEEKIYRLKELPIEPERIHDIDSEVEKLRANLKGFSSNDKLDLLDKKAKLQADLDEINKELSLLGQNEKIDERIAELEKEEKELAKGYEEQQKIIYLCEEYTKAYVDLVSDRINNGFNLVKFKLFDQQVNGVISEACEVLFDGVPYGDLNNAAKINAGLDVINTLSAKLAIQVPIFIDNAESVNELVETESQVVRLVVSKDKELQIG